MSKKVLVLLASVGVLIGAGSATALTWGSAGLLKNPPDCTLAINKSLPACAVPPTVYASAG